MDQEEKHYRRLLREYEEVRQEREALWREQKDELYKKLPKLKELDGLLAEESVLAGTKALEGDASALAALQDTIRSIAEQKQSILAAAGYPKDYPVLTCRCPDCKDTGFLGTGKCHCLKQALTFALSDNGSLPKRLEKENFSTFSYSYYEDAAADPQLAITPRQNIQNVVESAKKFIQSFDSTFQNLLIYGNTGVGKTFLANCIAKELLDSAHHIVYLTAFQLFEAFGGHQNRTDDTASTLYRYIFDCDLLIIDDLGTELSNAFTNTSLYTCINERLNTGKSTLISTNLSLEQLRECYSERIFSRITGNYTFFKLIGKDIRLQKRIQEQNA